MSDRIASILAVLLMLAAGLAIAAPFVALVAALAGAIPAAAVMHSPLAMLAAVPAMWALSKLGRL